MIQLSQVVDPPPRRRALPDEPVRYHGIDVAADCRAAVAKVCGGWGTHRGRDSDHERDALAQSLAVWALEHSGKVEALTTPERRALYRQVLAQDLIRDSRQWQDSLEGRAMFRTRARSGDGKRKLMVLTDESVSEQAKRYREHEREQRPAPFTSLDALTARHTDPLGQGVDWLEVAADLEAEREAGEQLPAVALAEHSRELAALMVERIAERLADRPNPIDVAGRERDALLVALLMASGERLSTIASAHGCGIATAKRRSAEGARLLRLLLSASELVGIRRDCVRELDGGEAPAVGSWREADASDPVLIAARAAVDGAISQERQTAALYLSGARPPRASVPHGTAREVLAYLATLERLLSASAWTLDTSAARAMPTERGQRVASRSHGPALDCWQPRSSGGILTTVLPMAGEAIREHARRTWPDRITGGQPHYSERHHARLAEQEARRLAGDTDD